MLLSVCYLLVTLLLVAGLLLLAGWWQFSGLNKNYWLNICRGVVYAQRRAFRNRLPVGGSTLTKLALLEILANYIDPKDLS